MKRLALLAVFLFLPSFAHAQVRTDRLERLAAHLDTVSPAKFSMSLWGTTSHPDDPNYVGCAAGHGTTIFASEGFRPMTYVFAPGESPTFAPMAITAAGKEVYGMNATCEFFGIEYVDNLFLFTGHGGAEHNPRKAAANIRQVIAREQVRTFVRNKISRTGIMIAGK